MLEMLFVLVAALVGLSSVLAVVIAIVRERPTSEPFRYEVRRSAVRALVDTLGRPERSLDVVAGELFPFAWPELAEALVEGLEGNRRLEVRILGGPTISPVPCPGGSHATYEQWKEKAEGFNGRFQMRFAKDRQEQHFSVIDGSVLMLEDPHASGEPRTGRIYRGTYFAARRFHRRFEQVWRTVETVSEPKIQPCNCPDDSPRGRR